ENPYRIGAGLAPALVGPRRPHVYELDPLRITTALVVVAVHVLAFTVFLNQTTMGVQIQNAVITAIHYTREMFMFVTAFALVYVYYGKPFSATRFWKRRAVGVFLPYCIWSLVYLLVNQPQRTLSSFITTLILDIISGSASYQLYFILLSLQFYILFPLFLPFVSFIKKHPWTTLAISFVLEVLMLYVDYHTLQRGAGAGVPLWHFIWQCQDSIIFTYQFYFILGALTAIYLPQVRSFLKRWGWWTLPAFLVALLALWVHYFMQVLYYKEASGYATSVLQPIMTFFSLAIIAFFFWLAYRWASNVDEAGHPRSYRVWSVLSDASFGVYLIHALLLAWFLQVLVPAMPQAWPVVLRVLLTWIATAGSATLASIILMNIPVLSRLVGRSKPLPYDILVWKRLQKPIMSTEKAPHVYKKADI
ncbi:MAG TPA: acyltransferase, partial [Ktedonobacteraceae bacterium]|nr:acyltransferase [Ktedonobacteraceae bacterium]